MPNENNSSGVNTVLIVIVLLILVGFGVWWFAAGRAPSPADTTPNDNSNGGINLDVTIPNNGTSTSQ